jgi:deazaflavin-dependent oxidoreductase (nitroreductase family)
VEQRVPVAAALLETRGARTGEPRRTATLYFHDGDRITVVAALRGWPRNPTWYYNLRANPDVLFGGLPFRAEIVEDAAERRRLWDLAKRVCPQYADFGEHAAKAGRVIPIVQLVRRVPPPLGTGYSSRRQRCCALRVRRPTSGAIAIRTTAA